jgi:hypothetical protein
MTDTGAMAKNSLAKPDDARREAREFKLRWYQARLGFWQTVCVTLISGGLAVAIPGAVDAYKSYQNTKLRNVELDLKREENEGKRIQFDQDYISKFLEAALTPDVEKRVRLGQYFSYVSSDKYRDGWAKYFDAVATERNDVRDKINAKQAELRQLKGKPTLGADDVGRLDRLERELHWLNAEVGYD